MRVLYATPRPPWPPHEGDQVVAWEQLRRLGGRQELTLVTLDTELEDEAGLRQALAPHCRAVHVLRGGRDRRRMVRSLWNGLPLLVNAYTSPRLVDEVAALARQVAPDLVHAQTIHLAEHVRRLPGPKVLDLIDPLSLNLERRARVAGPARALLLRAEAARLRRYEASIALAFDRVVVVSEEDAAALPGLGLVANPLGTHVTPEAYAGQPEVPRAPALVFHGTLRYQPNVDAAVWFTRRVFPRLRAAHPGLALWLVGRSPVPAVQALAGDGVVVTGAVDDVVPWLRRAQVGVYPLRAGTGIKFKVLEALACGLPCVLSPAALQGIHPLRPQEHLLLATDEEAWAREVDRLLRDPALRERLGRAGQAAIAGRYTWEQNAARLERLWEDAARTPRP